MRRRIVVALYGAAALWGASATGAAAEDPTVCLWNRLPEDIRGKLAAGAPTWSPALGEEPVQAATIRAMRDCGLSFGLAQIDALLVALPAYPFELRQRAAFEAAGGDAARLDRAWAALSPAQRDALYLKDPGDRSRFTPVMKPLVNGLALSSQEQAFTAGTFFMARARRAAADAVLAGSRP